MAAAAEGPGFEHMGLDPRLLRAVSELGWGRPTAVQAQALPLALEGRDLLVRARTGSGKTGAYGLGLLQHVLRAREVAQAVPQAVRALVLVPSRELSLQVLRCLRRLAAATDVRVAELGDGDPAALRPVLAAQPDVLVGTPGRVLAQLNAHTLVLRHSLELLVLDEADLLLGFGCLEDIKALLCHLPKIYQALLMSATFSPDVEALKELVLHNPVRLCPAQAPLPGPAQLRQLVLRCGTAEDKVLVLVALLRLRLLRGRALLFVSSLPRCYRLKLLLEQFGIGACVLNPELPARSRCHIIAQFNRGIYDYIVATDEEAPGPEPVPEPEPKQPQRKKRRGPAQGKATDPEFSAARGIDFQDVAAVINFDVPVTVEAYIHRVGRTARADNPGTALTLALPDEEENMARIEDALAADNGESMLQPYKFCMEEIEGLRYRCRDAMRAVTKQAVKEARLREIKDELLNSEKLKVYFEDNPRDLHVLRHDRPLHPAVVQPHLRNVPDYLVPHSLRASLTPGIKKRKGQRLPHTGASRRGGVRCRRSGNPLQSFKYSQRRSKRPGAAAPS
ncbi:probable ATP-dependent RNA helicase DDX56 [Melopsittacus undulatus]|uniref:probable ATP-dependent RNA helicase DDX56 n=1 Tax=Melopsittacus undulatus TaxID=13146 RepID=UPI00146A2934|nr:probable ATP-dependent RNA helicase DDX56 [Melopsittacus undulatus]